MPTRQSERRSGTRRQGHNGINKRDPRRHGTLGVVLSRQRIAEIDQDPIAHVFGDKAVEAADRGGDAAMIGADHIAQILGIELRRERRRADQIDKHDRDIQLPYISGLELTKWLKQEDDLRMIPVIAVTAFAMKGDEEKIRQSGCEGYITKPIAMMSFLDTVKCFVSQPST